MKKACVHIYCGEGKGKTTAAVGMTVRAAGAGRKVLMGIFLKNRQTSETALLEKLGIEVLRAESRIERFVFELTEAEERQYAAEQRELFRRICGRAEEGFDMIVLDEILDAVELGMIDCSELVHFLENKGDVEIVLTGRQPCAELQQLADYHSRIEAVRHPYGADGLRAREGIEY